MTRLNFTFQEASPLITYSKGWLEGDPSLDNKFSSYNGSFRVTSTAAASASFTFTGTGVSIFGAFRLNHGNYTVALDQSSLFTAFGSANDAFNKSLWHADNLGYTQHTVTFTNVPTGPAHNFFDVDYLSIERQIGQDGDTIFQAAIDDTSPFVKYTGTWLQTNGDASAHQGTLRSTTEANAQAVITFQGCCIELYGKYANALYTVTLDNQQPVQMQGLDTDLAPNFQHPQTLLYLVDGLSETKNHTVALTNTNSQVNRPFSFDYALVSSTHNLTSTSDQVPLSGSSGNANSRTNAPDSPPVGAVVGGVVGGLVIVLVLVLGFLFMRRRRRRRAEPAFPLDLIDEEAAEAEPKPYILPSQSEGENGHHGAELDHNRALPPVPGGAVRSSKLVAQMTFYPRGGEPASEEGLLSPQERWESSGSSSYVPTGSTGTSASRSGTSSSRTASTSRRRDTKTPASNSSQGAGPSSRAEEPGVQEEDAGVVLEPEDQLAGRSLPPAYNPEWDRDRGLP